MNQQLIDYIKNQIKLGRSEDVIKVMLKNNGWQEADIEEGFREVFGQNTPLPSPSTDFQPAYSSNRPSFSGNASEIALPGGLDLLKQSWQIYKNRFWTLVGITAFPFLIWLVIGGLFWMSSFVLANSGLNILFIILALILVIPGIILFVWSGLALIYVVKESNEEIGFKESFRQAWGKKILSFAFIGLLNTLVIFGGFILGIIPGIIFAIWFIVAQFVFVVEGQKGFSALLRSKEYVAGRWGKVFWRVVVFGLVALGVGLINWGISFGMIMGLDWLSYPIIFGNILSFIEFLINILFGLFAVVYFFSLYTALRQTRPQLVNQQVVAKKGFFVFCAILGVLAPFIIAGTMMITTISLLNPGKQFAEARDTQRISDIRSLNVAISLYEAVIDQGIDCQNNKIYRSDIGTRAVDGTGWLSIDFTKIPGGGSPLTQLNIDPLNNSEFFYSYACVPETNVFELNTRLESKKYLDMMRNDGGDDPNVYEVGSNLNPQIPNFLEKQTSVTSKKEDIARTEIMNVSDKICQYLINSQFNNYLDLYDKDGSGYAGEKQSVELITKTNECKFKVSDINFNKQLNRAVVVYDSKLIFLLKSGKLSQAEGFIKMLYKKIGDDWKIIDTIDPMERIDVENIP